DVRAGVGPEHVAGVAVAMQPQRTHVAGPRVAAAHAVQCLVDDAAIRVLQVRGDEALRQQVVARLFAEARDVEGRPGGVAANGPLRVEAAEEAAEPGERGPIVELRRPAATLR